MDRRRFLTASGTIATALTLPSSAKNMFNRKPSIKAIIFDAFPIFDPRSVFKLAIELFPEKGQDLVKEWKTKQFEYTWLRSISNNYIDFLTITEDALVYAGKTLDLEITKAQRTQLTEAFYQLQTWPDVSEALNQLSLAGYRLGFLSNFTNKMLVVNVNNCNLKNHFEHLLSVESVKKYKPDPKTYQMGLDAFGLTKEEILFVAFAGWDAAGSEKFGYKTFWVNRMQAPLEQLGVFPKIMGKDLNDLLRYCNTI